MADIVLHAYHEGKCPVQIIDYEWRVENIKEVKPGYEHELRFARIKKIPINHLPVKARGPAKKLIKARDDCVKAWDDYVKARDDYDKAWDDYDKARKIFEAGLTPEEWDKWHKKHCVPECKWSIEHPNIFKGE